MSQSAGVPSVRPFGIRDKIGYMFGDFGNDFTFILQSSFFLVFFTNVVGIEAAHVGILLLIARLLDAFVDVAIGIIVDRLSVKNHGTKFKRWIKWFALPVAISSALMYMSFVADFNSYGGRVLWMCITYFLWGSFCYSAINIPYGSMASVVSSDPNDRAQLSVWRSTGSTLASAVITAVIPLFAMTKNSAGVSVMVGSRMTIAAVACSILAVLCYTITYHNVEERVHPTEVEGAKRPSVGAMLKSVFSNRALLGLIVAALLLLLAMLFMNSMMSYLFLSWFEAPKAQSAAALAGSLPAIILIVLAPAMAKRWGKAEVGIVFMIIGGAVFIVAYFMHIKSAVLWTIFYAVAMFCIFVFNYLVWAFVTDVIDDHEVHTGQRDDATTYAVYSWARKLGQALAGWLAGQTLTWIGYDSAGAKAGAAQADSVINSIYMLTNLLPGVLCLAVALALIFLYPLKKNVVLKNQQILESRRAEQQVALSKQRGIDPGVRGNVKAPGMDSLPGSNGPMRFDKERFDNPEEHINPSASGSDK
ncbi:MFS transporter [Neoactinobaculum massilliense]|uniref:MFS transporter n=1 Tax=Neoactinobaculum massilliense TaxID=2364794 RepID=UPI000F5253DC|nr:glycoside-pentoside-hexuronide (GPH):cation symporter [Neoactinobaculum massilliense]